MKLKLNDGTELTMTDFRDIEGGIKVTLEEEIATVQTWTDEQLSRVELIGDEGSTYKQITNIEIKSISLDVASKYITVEFVNKSLKEQIADLQAQIKEMQDVISEQQVMLTNLAQTK